MYAEIPGLGIDTHREQVLTQSPRSLELSQETCNVEHPCHLCGKDRLHMSLSGNIWQLRWSDQKHHV